MKIKLLGAGLAAFLVFCTTVSWCQDSQTPKYKISFSERFRIETTDNATSLNNDAGAGSSYTRHRTSLSGLWMPSKPYEFCLKLTNEFRNYFVPENRTFNIDEVFIDQLYFKWKASLSNPLTATLGRQNITLGEGFVIMDGGPLDGSRSAYFNAARFDYDLWTQKTVTAIFTVQNEKDDILPIINDKDKALTEQDEKAAIVYFTGVFGTRNLQAYYIRKDADSSKTRPYSLENNTMGLRLLNPFGNEISLTLEAAYQRGKVHDIDQKAFGGYGYLSWKPEQIKKYPTTLTIGGIYLSGDDPETDDYDGWDPLYGRWPKWSDSYIYTLVKENGVANWSNMISLYGKVQIEMAPNLKCNLDYHHLTAPQKSAPALFPGGDGKTRGDLLIGKLVYQINKKVNGHLLWERFYPGNYYFENAVPSNWFRMEFLLNI